VGDVLRDRFRGDGAFGAEVAGEVLHGGEDSLLAEVEDVLREVVL